MYFRIGLGLIKMTNLTEILKDVGEKTKWYRSFFPHLGRSEEPSEKEENHPHYEIASCCHPIPGDDILGYIDDNSHSLIIHKRNCETATKLKSKFGNNIIATRWDVHKTPFKARIAITGIDCNGILLKIADTLYSHEHINVTALNIEGKDGVFEASLSVLVHNVHEVTSICQSLQQIENIVKAYRVD